MSSGELNTMIEPDVTLDVEFSAIQKEKIVEILCKLKCNYQQLHMKLLADSLAALD